MTKKTFSLVLVVLLIFSLVGCNATKTVSTTIPNDTETMSQENQQTIDKETSNEITKEDSQTDADKKTETKPEVEQEKDTDKDGVTQSNNNITYIYDTPYLIVENSTPVYSGEHYIATIDKADTGIKVLDDTMCVSYQEYVDYCAKFGITQKYTNKNQNYIIISDATHITKYGSTIVADVIFQDDGKIFVCQRVTASFNNESGNLKGYMVVIPIEKNIQNPTIHKAIVLTKEESSVFGDIQ